MRVRWFGPSWNAPVNARELERPTPAGQHCNWCGDEILIGERGLIVGARPGGKEAFVMDVYEDSTLHWVCAEHIDCLLEALVGEYDVRTVDRKEKDGSNRQQQGRSEGKDERGQSVDREP